MKQEVDNSNKAYFSIETNDEPIQKIINSSNVNILDSEQQTELFRQRLKQMNEIKNNRNQSYTSPKVVHNNNDDCQTNSSKLNQINQQSVVSYNNNQINMNSNFQTINQSSYSNAMRALQLELQNLKQKNIDDQDTYQNIINEKNDIITQLKNTIDRHVDQSTNISKQYQQQILELQNSQNQVNHKNNTNQDLVQELQQRIKLMDEENERNREKYLKQRKENNLKIIKLNDQVEELQNQNISASETIQKQKYRIVGLEDKLKHKDQQMLELKEYIEKRLNDNNIDQGSDEILLKNIQEKNQEIEKYKLQLQQYQYEGQRVENELHSQVNEYKRSQLDLQRLNNHLKNNNLQIEEYKVEKQELNNQIEYLKSQLIDRENSLVMAQEVNKKKDQELYQMHDNIQYHNSKKGKIENFMKLQQEMLEINKQLATKKDSYDRNQDRNVKREIKELQRDLEQKVDKMLILRQG